MTDIEKVNRRFKAHYYTHGKLDDWSRPPAYLLSGGSHPTKIRPEDLPPWFIRITYWNSRFVDTSRVSDIVYRPCRIPHHNHLFKDDFLFLAYDGDRLEFNEFGHPSSCSYEALWGYEIVDALISVRDYSGLDITKQLDELRAKVLRYNEEYNEPYPDPSVPYDPDQIIARAEQRVIERRDAYAFSHPGTYCP